VSARSRWRWRAPPAGLVGTRGGTPPPSLQSSGGGIYSQRQLISCAPPFAPRPLQTQIRGSPQNSAAAYFRQLHIFCLIFFSLQNCLRALLKVTDCAKVGKLGLFGRWTRFFHLSIAARSRVLRTHEYNAMEKFSRDSCRLILSGVSSLATNHHSWKSSEITR
jgi:hypothetical protein